MALGFAVQELGLYLEYNKLYGEGVAEYERRYGPLQLTASDGTDWARDPWPWDGQSAQQAHMARIETAALEQKGV